MVLRVKVFLILHLPCGYISVHYYNIYMLLHLYRILLGYLLISVFPIKRTE